jgi:uncharacterized phage protein gp47/JayE
MVARSVARSDLVGILRNSAVFHVLAAAADSDAELYFQLSQLQRIFSIDRATGSELDRRAAEIQPATVRRREEVFAVHEVIYTRNTTLGTTPIPAGTLAAGRDEQGNINVRTTAAGSITPGNTESAGIPAIATIAGVRGNLAAGAVVRNTFDASTGRNRESDDRFRQRIKDSVASLARGTKTAIEGFAREVVLSDGQRVLFARADKPVVPTGFTILYIDDGSGNAETFDDSFVGGIAEEDVLVAAAVGDEFQLQTSQLPIRDDAALILRLNDVVVQRGLDWAIDPARGKIEFLPGGVRPTGLQIGDKVGVNYRFYTGLIQRTQKVITGDPADETNFPGVESGGITTLVQAATPVFQTLTATVVTRQGFDLSAVRNEIEFVIQDYINNLDIGEDVIKNEIVERCMGVTGVFNFKIIELSGSTSPSDQVILPNQAARIISNDIQIN